MHTQKAVWAKLVNTRLALWAGGGPVLYSSRQPTLLYQYGCFTYVEGSLTTLYCDLNLLWSPVHVDRG